MNLGYLGEKRIKYAFQMDIGGYYYVYLINETPDVIFKGSVEFLGSKNLEVLQPY